MIGGPDYRDIPDTDNDEVRGSSAARDSPNKKPINGLRRSVLKISHALYLIDITRIIAYSFFSLTGGI
jgi:hypothetical protein